MIIGLTGTIGAGKGTVVQYLKEKGFEHFSARTLIEEELKKRNLPIDRSHMADIGNEIRKKNDAGYIIRTLYDRALSSGKNSIVESVRTPGELKSLKDKKDFYLIAVDADIKIRYERIKKRGTSTDNISYEQFVADEEREFSSEDPYAQNISACIKMADFNIINNGDIKRMREQVDEILGKIKNNKT